LKSAQHVLICSVCETFEYLATSEHLNARLRDEKRKHFADLQGRVASITVIYDDRDETDPYLSALMKWRAEHAGNTEGP
jgi:hypothetical protein